MVKENIRWLLTETFGSKKVTKLKFDPKKFKQPSTKPKKSRSNPELRRIFWRTFTTLKWRNNGINPENKHVWDAIYDEYKDFKANEDLNERKIYDPNETIELMDHSSIKKAHLNWHVRADYESGTYKLISLPGLLRNQKKDPPHL